MCSVKFLLLTVCSVTAWAGEYAILSNGFRIHADNHATEGGVVRLETNQGIIELPASLVAGFEPEDYTPPAAPLPQKPSAAPANPLNATARELVTRAAADAGLPPEIVQSIAKAESNFNPNAVSRKGAIGPMQLMPKTAADLEANPYNPAENAAAGARYLRDLLLKYANDPHQVSKAIAAYNAGPAAVDKYNGVPPYRETVTYVYRVLKEYEKAKRNSATTPESSSK
jgi:soluble lytic murein transglycosylase-like protein